MTECPSLDSKQINDKSINMLRIINASVPPATQEAEARGSLKPISSKPAWEIYRDLLLEKKRCLWI
jgi:hypothetical protein